MASVETTQQQQQQQQQQYRPRDFFGYLTGFWKRNLEWRELGGQYEFLRTSNTVVHVEEQQLLIGEPGARALKWAFGSSLSRRDLRIGYVMRVLPAPDGASGDMRFEWEHAGTPCRGEYFASTGVAVLRFFQRASTVTVTYRVLDADAMAVVVVEAEAGKPAILQLGTMLRIDAEAYAKHGAPV